MHANGHAGQQCCCCHSILVLVPSDICMHAFVPRMYASHIATVAGSYQAPSFWCWVVVGVLAAHLTLLLQQGQGLAGVQQSHVPQALCHHYSAFLFTFTAAHQQLQDLAGIAMVHSVLHLLH